MLQVLAASNFFAAIVEWSSKWTYVMFGGLLLMIIMGTWAGAVADRKGRSMQGWFLIGFFVPVIGLVAAYTVKPIEGKESKIKSAEQKDKGGKKK